MELAYRLILYILIANVGYMVYSLARRGFQANSGYLIQLSLIMGFMVSMLATGQSGFWAVVVSLMCLIVTVFIPFMIQRTIENRLAEQRFDEIEDLAWWKAALSWSDMNAHLLTIARVGKEIQETPQQAEVSLRRLLGKGEPYDGMTRLFLAMMHFHQRQFSRIIEDLVVPGKSIQDYSFEELLYLVRGHLETGQFEEAVNVQTALEQKAREETSPHLLSNLLVSRLLFFALMGWISDFRSLLEGNKELRDVLPDMLKEYWEGVGVYYSGNGEVGIAQMERAVGMASEEIPEHWVSWMRKRISEMREQIPRMQAELLPRLSSLRETHHETFGKLSAEVGDALKPEVWKTDTTNVLTYALIGVYLVSSFGYNVEDIVQLVNLGANSGVLVRQGEIFRLFTSLFLHIGLVHLLMNVLALKYFGPPVETVTGRAWFLTIFFFSGLCGSLASVHSGIALSVGASGAVLGLLSASIMLEWFGGKPGAVLSRHENLGTLIFILVINLIIGSVEKGIDNGAHLGGLGGGAITGFLAARFLRWPRILMATGVSGSLGILLFAGFCLNGYLSSATEHCYPQSQLPLVKVPRSFNGLSLSIPKSWTIETASKTADATEFSIQGPFNERIDLSAAATDEPPEFFVKNYFEQRTRSLASDEIVKMRSVGDPASFSIGLASGYRMHWRMSTSSHPLIIRDYFLFFPDRFVLLQCLLPTDKDAVYDNVFQQFLESVRFTGEPLE